MFCRCFGNYLLEKNIISSEQLSTILEYRRMNRVKLGLIAVDLKLLTKEKAEEVNRLQATMDRRFGDIAIEKGYLTENDVTKLLALQGNPYLIFVQAVTENHILSKETVDVCLTGFQKDNEFSDMDMEAIKNGDMDTIVSLFINVGKEYSELISLALRNINRFISNDIAMGKLSICKELSYQHIAFQRMNGAYDALLGFACNHKELLAMAVPYGKEEFTSIDADSLDAVCEFCNCTNGLYASKLSHDNIDLEMLPPQAGNDIILTSEGDIYDLPIQVDGVWVDMIVCMREECKVTSIAEDRRNA